ncbi:MAG: copper amine oxidase N-terminal domain-containing protein [Bacillota bacterium]
MIKIRRKWLSILLTLAMLSTLLLPLAGPASASTSNTALTVPNISTGTAKTLGTMSIVESTPGSIEEGQVFTLTLLNGAKLTSGVSWQVYDTGFNPAGTTTGAFVYAPDAVGDDSNRITDLVLVSSNEYSATVKVNAINSANDKGILRVYFKQSVDVSNSGDVSVDIAAPSTGFSEGSVVVAHAVGAGTTASAISTKTVGSGTGKTLGTLRIQENSVGALEIASTSSNTIKITAPVGFKITSVSGLTYTGFPTGTYVVDVALSSPNDRYAYIKVEKKSTTYPGMIQFAPVVSIDSSEATMGDITFSVGGTNPGVTSADVKLGTYGDYGATVTADTATEILAAKAADQKIAKITIKEALAGSIINGRTLKLTLNGDAKWVDYPTPNYAEGTSGFLGSASITTDGKTLEYTVSPATTSAAKVEFKNFTVKTSAAMSGDLKVTVGGTAGVSGEVTVATVKPRVTGAAASTPDVIIGQQDQTAGEFTITEAKAEAIKKITGETDLKVVAPSGIEWAVTPTVAVYEGDLQIDTVSKSGGTVSIDLKTVGSKPSTLKFSNVKLTVDRTVPVGAVELKIQGAGINDTTADWPDATTVAKVKVANCVTPAPTETKGTAVFKIGDAKYTMNGVETTMDAAAYVENGRTFVPLRYVAYAAGVSAENILYANGKVTIIKGDKVIQLTIGSTTMVINGISITMDVPAVVKSGRTMLPVRWVAQALGCSVTYDETAQTVTVQ